ALAVASQQNAYIGYYGLLFGIVKKIPTRWVKKKVELTIP
ncbi:hypothetical protein LCGC14_1472020, partial [marine sediment metagenome]